MTVSCTTGCGSAPAAAVATRSITSEFIRPSFCRGVSPGVGRGDRPDALSAVGGEAHNAPGPGGRRRTRRMADLCGRCGPCRAGGCGLGGCAGASECAGGEGGVEALGHEMERRGVSPPVLNRRGDTAPLASRRLPSGYISEAPIPVESRGGDGGETCLSPATHTPRRKGQDHETPQRHDRAVYGGGHHGRHARAGRPVGRQSAPRPAPRPSSR